MQTMIVVQGLRRKYLYLMFRPIMQNNKKNKNSNNHSGSHSTKNDQKNKPKNNNNNNNNSNNRNFSKNIKKSNNKKSANSFNLKNFNYTDMTEDEIIQNFTLMAKDQTGCRFLQKKIENEHTKINSFYFDLIVSDFINMANDTFGNYLVQKIVEYLDAINMSRVLNLVHLYLNFFF